MCNKLRKNLKTKIRISPEIKHHHEKSTSLEDIEMIGKKQKDIFRIEKGN